MRDRLGSLPPEDVVWLCQQTLPEDTRAFEALVSQFKGKVYATAYRLMGNRHDAEDQAQEVFIKVYRGIGELSDPATVGSWIYRITVNTCFEALGKRHRSPSTVPVAPLGVEQDDQEQYVDTVGDTPEQAALHRELRECLEDTLQQLDLAERAVLVLRDVEGRPYQEIAEVLAVGLSAVKMRIHRARLAFQQLFESICPDLWRPDQVADTDLPASR